MKNRRSEAIAKTTRLLVAFFLAGALATGGLIYYTDRQMRKELLVQSSLVAGAVDIESVKTLTGTRADVRSPDFLHLKEQLAAVRAANPKCRFVYLMGRRAEGPVFFFLDVQDDSRERAPASQPGDVYDDATPELIAGFSNGIPFVEGPVSDDWGTLISALVPLADPHTGQCVAVLGMDFDAREWMWDVAARAALPVALVLLAMIGLVAVLGSSVRASGVPKPILMRLLPVLAILLLLLFVVAGAMSWQMRREVLRERTERMAGEVVYDLQASLKDQAQGLASAVHTIALEDRMRQALRSGDRARLFADWRPLFETLQRENGLAHFYFTDTNRVCLLRVDQPKIFGDRIDQFTIRAAERTGKIASGIDIGLRGTPVLRMVKPVFDGSTLIGYVGVGKEIEDILQAFRSRHAGIELAIVIRKNLLDRASWEAGRLLLGRASDWDRLPNGVVVYASQGRVPDAFAALAAPTPAASLLHETIGQEVATGGKFWHFAVSPLKDASGTEVGDLLIMDDITALKVAFARDMLLNVTAGAILLATLLAMFFVLLRRAEAGIYAQQAKLRESEKLLARAEELAQTGSWKLDLSANRFTASAGTYRIFGYDPEDVSATYETFLALVHPDDRAAVDAAYSGSLKNGNTDCEIAYRIARRDSGEIRTVRVHYVHERDDAGTLIQTSGMVQDITERKRVEQLHEMVQEVLQILNEPGDLKESLQRIVALMKARTEVDAVGMRLLSGEDFPYFVQNGFTEGFLRTENTLLHHDTDGRVCRDEDGNVSPDCTCGLVLSGKTDPASPFFTQGGSFWSNDSFSLLDLPADQDPRTRPRNTCIHAGYASIALIPIRTTERIVGLLQFNDLRKGRFILETIELLEGVAAHIGSALMRTWSETALQESEARFKALHNASFGGIFIHDANRILDCNKGLSEMTGYSFEELTAMDGLLLTSEQSRNTASANSARGYEKPYELIAVRKNGEEYPVRVEARNVPYKGKMVRAVEFRDITEQKRAEAEHESLQAQLIVAQKMESVGRLAGGVAHDFNNMLQAILGYTDLALEQVPPGEPLHEDLEAIKNTAQRSAQLTQQLLAFARRQVVVPKVVDFNDTIAGMLKLLRRLIGEDVDLVWRPGTDVWPVKMDPVQIDQILANLCVNARDAIAGVGRITLETNTVSFDDAGCKLRAGCVPGDYVLLAVSDTGCGMDAETRAHIFEPFFSTKAFGKGTGLGLATVYGAVQQNHGFIDVYSEPGQGSTFKIYLPRHAAQATPKPTGETGRQSVVTAGGSETILLVEDDPLILKTTQKMLERLGYAVLACETPAEAIRLAGEKSGHIHLLLTDVVMPKMNGRDLADTLLALYPNLKCLFMSGYTADVIANQGVLDEGVHFLQKPFSTAKLGAMLRRILEG